MRNASLCFFQTLGRASLLLSLALISTGQTSCSGSEPGASNGGSSSVGGSSAVGGSSVAGGSSAVGGSPVTGGSSSTEVLGTGVCYLRPSSCYPMCQGGLCECYCPNTGGAGSGTGGASASGGSANTGGSAGAGGLCGSNCSQESPTGSFCGTSTVTLICHGPFADNLQSIMTANGCVDAGTNAVRYCCPTLILTQCQ
jgi:hypothetical protein